MVAREVPTSSTMAVPHGPASVGAARRRLRRDLGDREVPDAVIDDAVLILSELLSNSCRYARPLAPLLDLDGGAGGEFHARPRDWSKSTDGPEFPDGRTAASGGSQGSGHTGEHSRAGEQFGGPGEPGGFVEPAGYTERPGGVLVRWQMHDDGLLTLEVTDGGAVTRPLPASPSLTSKGGRGLSIVGKLATEWGVRDAPGEVTVWAALPAHAPEPAHARSA
ncbi:ATP-binding protein [Kitasatospora nipponensis]